MKQLARQWISLWNAPGNKELFYALHSPGFQDCSSAGRGSDRDSFYSGICKFLEAFPDVVTVTEDIIPDSETGKIAIRWNSKGVNRVQYLGVGPTNKLTGITGIEIIEVSNGQIIRRWGEWDISHHFSNAKD